MQQRLQAAEQRAVAAEQDTTRLLAAVRLQSTAHAATAAAAADERESLTHDAVQARYRRAQELARTGDPADDRLPAGDPRRSQLAMVAFDQLREAKRYAHAAEGMTFSQMQQRAELRFIERSVPSDSPNAERMRKAQRTAAVSTVAKLIEVLAGIGKTEQARNLIDRALAFDQSPETREILQQHAERAGQPELLRGAAGQ